MSLFFQQAFKHSNVIDWFMKLCHVCTALSIPSRGKNWTKISFICGLMWDLGDEVGRHEWKVNVWFLSRRARLEIFHTLLSKNQIEFFHGIQRVYKNFVLDENGFVVPSFIESSFSVEYISHRFCSCIVLSIFLVLTFKFTLFLLKILSL